MNPPAASTASTPTRMGRAWPAGLAALTVSRARPSCTVTSVFSVSVSLIPVIFLLAPAGPSATKSYSPAGSFIPRRLPCRERTLWSDPAANSFTVAARGRPLVSVTLTTRFSARDLRTTSPRDFLSWSASAAPSNRPPEGSTRHLSLASCSSFRSKPTTCRVTSRPAANSSRATAQGSPSQDSRPSVMSTMVFLASLSVKSFLAWPRL